ncbi:UNVERIFIED_CONTAM: hypothetical protein NCL1_45296 [Trichonephila clavipes]
MSTASQPHNAPNVDRANKCSTSMVYSPYNAPPIFAKKLEIYVCNALMKSFEYKVNTYKASVMHEPQSPGVVRYATAMCIYTLQDALFICYKQSPDNARSVAFSQRANSPRLIEDKTLNDYALSII